MSHPTVAASSGAWSRRASCPAGLTRRISAASLSAQTPRATEIAHQMQATIVAAEQQMLRSLSPKQIAALEDTLRTIYADLG